MKKYKLEKISIKEGHSSAVHVGSATEHPNAYVSNDKLIDPTENPDLSDIKVGDRVLIFRNMRDFIKTSDITKIVDVSEDSLEFETTTSAYRLEITNE